MKKMFHNFRFILGGRTLVYVLSSLTITAALTTIDIVHEVVEGVGWGYLLLEASIFLTATLGILGIVVELKSEKRMRAKLDNDLIQAKAEVEGWQSKVQNISRQFFQAMDEQFTKWELSKAEKEIAILLVKGMSTKDIALYREVTEKTVRAHASAVYRKSNLHTRYELAAYFIDALMN